MGDRHVRLTTSPVAIPALARMILRQINHLVALPAYYFVPFPRNTYVSAPSEVPCHRPITAERYSLASDQQVAGNLLIGGWSGAERMSRCIVSRGSTMCACVGP
jgi:hypothetical protein